MNRQIVEVDEMPILVHGVSSSLIAIQSIFALRPSFVESGADTAKLTLVIDRTPNQTITGTVTLVPLKSWDVWPREFALRTSRNEVQEVPLELRFPTGEVAGTKTLTASVRLPDDEGFFEVPLSFEFGLNGVDVWGMAVLEGDKLVVQHGLTNKTNSVLNLRSAASVPGRERQYRSFTNVEPGETQVVKYRYPDGGPLVGRRIRLGIRELNDGRRSHNLDVVVP